MRAISFLVAVFCLLAGSAVHADSTIASVQRTLKDQGFYYGEITGTKDADTVAAIRRYQIRNGLQITGELNAETQKSLGLKGAAPAAPIKPAPAPARPVPTPPPEASGSRKDSSRLQEPSTDEEDEFDSTNPAPAPGFGPTSPSPDRRSLFQGTPYEMAAPGLQEQVIVGAQTLLARRGYYRSAIDGVYGPGMEFAVRAYQSRFGI